MSPTLAKDAGRLKLRSTKQYQPQFSPPRYTSDSVLGAKLTSPTSSYPRCGINLVDTWRNPRANPKWLEGTLPRSGLAWNVIAAIHAQDLRRLPQRERPRWARAG